tara:strand:- start:538 stop:816 length:279 start_codon:yes stop_codon:yes gene_type:complete
MKIKHKGKVYLIETEKYKTVWLTKEEMLKNRYMLQCQNDEGLFMASIKAPKNEWTFTVCKDMGRCGLGLSHREQIATDFKTARDAKNYIKNI